MKRDRFADRRYGYQRTGPRRTTTSIVLELEAWHDGKITDDKLSKAARDWYRRNVVAA